MGRFIGVVAVSSALIGMVIGIRAGTWIEQRGWQKQLIHMGCAGYDMHTGEWTLTGGTCNVQAMEPSDAQRIR